jgi:Zn-dependent M28 family amino/carboxypeptidase
VQEGKIYNGADDDGSGTVSILELAEAFSLAATNGHRPRRSILFMTVSGEEKGLWGSEFYSDNPVYPIEKTVVDLNIDMIGRVDNHYENKKDSVNYVYIIGADKLSSELDSINRHCNNTYTHLKLDYKYNDPDDPNRFYYRSDHYNFARKGIPVIFYFTGVHEDYHKPEDDIEKIRFPKMVTINRLIFATAWELANRDKKIVVDKNPDKE